MPNTTQHIFLLLKLRAKQIGRLISQTGIGLLLVCLLVISGVLLKSYHQLISLPSYAALILTPVFIFIIDLNRKDKLFLKTIFPTWQQIGTFCSVEYLLLISPLLLFQIMRRDLLIVLGLIGVCILIGFCSPFFKPAKLHGHKKSIHQIPLKLFELKFYFEKNKLVLLSIMALALLGIVHFGFFIAALFIFIILLPEVFRYTEPLSMVKLEDKTVLKKTIKYISILGPIWMVAASFTYIFTQPPIWLLLYGIFCLIVAIVLGIGYKYANYSGIYPHLPSSNIISLMVILLVIPGGVLITFVFSIINYIKAEKNMQNFYVTD